jgi:Mg2+/Co2+ transporter CorC
LKKLERLKFVPAGVHFFLLFLSLVVQPVLLVQELLATDAARYGALLVSILCMLDQFVIAPESCMAFFALVPFAVEKAHMAIMLDAGY